MNRILALAMAFALGASCAQAKACRDAHGKFTKCPVAVAPMVSGRHVGAPLSRHADVASPKLMGVAVHPHCVKGKPCGGSCIAMDKVCHK
jgi:hypothetical protein